jgi:hypothetical protein
MSTGVVYRPVARDHNGDAIDADGNVIRVGSDGTEVGTVDGLVIGGPYWQPANRRGDTVDTTGLVGVPVSELVQPAHGDLLVVGGIRYRVQGPAQWSHPNTQTGTSPRYNWFTVTAVAN